MEFDPNQFFIRKPDYLKISSLISVVVGVILIFISMFIDYPAFVFTASIGAVLILYYFIYKIYVKNKNKTKTIKVKKSKIGKVQRTQKIKGDKERVIAICPSCNQKLRLPYNKGVHGVNCPKCQHHFEVKN